MDDPQLNQQNERQLVSKGRFFEIVELTKEDSDRARTIPADGCPRRYCWWWWSLSFDWDTSAKDGCTVVNSMEPPPKYRGVPCCRSDRSSKIDHYEPRLPHIQEDGIDAARWLKYRFERDPEGLAHLKAILHSSDAESLRGFAIALLQMPATTAHDVWRSALLKWIDERLASC